MGSHESPRSVQGRESKTVREEHDKKYCCLGNSSMCALGKVTLCVWVYSVHEKWTSIYHRTGFTGRGPLGFVKGNDGEEDGLSGAMSGKVGKQIRFQGAVAKCSGAVADR